MNDVYICELCQRAFQPTMTVTGVTKLRTFKGYTVDLRLREFRKVKLSRREFRKAVHGKCSAFVDFDSPEGRLLLAQMHEQVTR